MADVRFRVPQKVIQLSYPPSSRFSITPETVKASDDWLASADHPPALRRLVSEGRAGIVRALAAQEFDRS